MTAQSPESALRSRSVGDIAATLPGATAVFREFKIDFCCNGDLALDSAAERRGVDPDMLRQALAALDAGAAPADAPAAMGSEELIRHIVVRYHDAHRQTLPELIALARTVEAVHRGHPNVPAGLSDVLQQMHGELVSHMTMEETMVFPAMLEQGDAAGVAIGELRHEHDEQGALLHQLEDLTDDFTLPEGACNSWQALYVSTAKLAEDLMEHIHLENNILFPRFAA